MRQSLTNEFLILAIGGIFLIVGAGCAKPVGTAEQSVGVFSDNSSTPTEEVFDERFMVQEEDLQDMAVKDKGMMNQGISAGLGDVFFEFDQSLIRPKDQKVLVENVRWLKADSARKITIQGHADERGTNEYNLTLGERRAQAAKRYLISQGIASHRIRTISYGEENPFCKNRNEVCFQQNRRGHFVKLN